MTFDHRRIGRFVKGLCSGWTSGYVPMIGERVKKALTGLLLLTAGGCYGRAAPDSCYRKYVVNHRGDETRDNYQACMVRANALEHGVSQDVEVLRERVAFETGCSTATVTVFEHTGNAATLVGVDACGQRTTYSRRLRRHLGMRSKQNTAWEVVGVSVMPTASTPATVEAPAAAPAHVRAPVDRVFGKAGSL
ncbi:MAG: hypothetical protein RLZZ450_298 [Pseudomonadota bacterium]|jgi:hypothetical protein